MTPAVDKLVAFRAVIATAAIVGSGALLSAASQHEAWPRGLTTGVGQQAFSCGLAAVCYVGLVRSLPGSIIGGAGLGAMCAWFGAGLATIEGESSLVMFFVVVAAPAPVLALSACEWVFLRMARWCRRARRG